MKALLMLLLLANLGFFAWQHWYGEEASDPFASGHPVEDASPRLALVGESRSDALAAAPNVAEPPPVQDDPAQELAEESVPSAPLITSLACATLGPFEERDVAQIALVRLDELGFPSSMRESGGQIRSGFWVYLPPFPSRDAAETVRDELRAKGVNDLFIVNGSVSGSEQQNAISLGLFSTPERADQRAAEIGRLGFAPRVAERFRDATVYWVDFVQAPGETLEPEALGVMGAGVTLPEKHTIPCADIAVEPDAA
ncbi:MAG TPA: SPOR domain-containing protein [Gammaproteobacteria bacterium]